MEHGNQLGLSFALKRCTLVSLRDSEQPYSDSLSKRKPESLSNRNFDLYYFLVALWFVSCFLFPILKVAATVGLTVFM